MTQFYKINFAVSFAILIFSCHTNQEKINSNNFPTPPPFSIVDTTKTLKEKELLDYLARAKTILPNKNNGVPFDTLHYDKIIGYDFVGSEELYSQVINEKGKYVPVILKQQYLTQAQADKILSTLTKNTSYGEATAACFNPHFALVFYKNNKKNNQINICLNCNYLISEIAIPAETHKKENIGTANEYSITGFTSKGKKAIIDLCKDLDFTYGQIEEKEH